MFMELVEGFESGFLPAYKCWEYFDAPKWFKSQDFRMEEEGDDEIEDRLMSRTENQ